MSLELSDVTFTYPRAESPILRKISLTVRAGEAVAVMGPSGTGKSTLLSLAGLLLSPDSGEVRVNGILRTPRDASAVLGRDLGWILQSVNLLPRRSILDNVALSALAMGETREAAHARAREMLERVGLDPDAARDARTLSGGEAQRVGVARALLAGPSVVLADEPTANLDGATAASVARHLFAARGDVALLVATHDPRIAEMADRVLLIDDGALVPTTISHDADPHDYTVHRADGVPDGASSATAGAPGRS